MSIKVLNPSHATPRSFDRVRNEEVLNRAGRVPHKRLIHRSIVAWNFTTNRGSKIDHHEEELVTCESLKATDTVTKRFAICS